MPECARSRWARRLVPLWAASLALACSSDAREPSANLDGRAASSARSGPVSESSGAGVTGMTGARAVTDDVSLEQAGTSSALLDAGGAPDEPAWEPPSAANDQTPTVFEPRCRDDRRGNWVCVWPAGEWGGGGPCAFGPDGAVSVASQLWQEQGSRMTARLARFDEAARLRWSRAWQRDGETAALTLSINALAVDAQGTLHWGGEDCDRSEQHPAAEPEAGYHGSCLNARLVTLDARGELLADRTFGTAGGLERISDLGVSAEGLYVAGSYHPPWQRGGRRIGTEAAGQNQFVMKLERGEVAWWRSFGTMEHDGDDQRLSVTHDDGVVVTGHSGLDTSRPGYIARLDASGAERWQYESHDVYISRTAVAMDNRVYAAPGPLRVDEAGAASTWTAPSAAALSRVRATAEGSLVLADYNGAASVVELDREGRLLRQLKFDGAKSLWYRGGLCVGSGRVAISSTIDRSSDFGILDTPLEIYQRSSFLLLLSSW